MEEGVQPTTEEHAEAQAPSCGACRLTLTRAEREVVAWAARLAQSQRDSRDMAGDYAASMRGLLERMGAANSGDDRRSVGGE
jgi:hypothetical protein